MAVAEPSQARECAAPSPSTLACRRATARAVAEQYVPWPWDAVFKYMQFLVYQRAGIPLEQPILDLGCGDGAFANVLCKLTGRSVLDLGIDLDKRSIARARRRGIYGAVVNGDIRYLPVGDACCATVFSNGVLHEVEDPYAVASEIARVLKPGGRLLFTAATPDFASDFPQVRALQRLGFRSWASSYARSVDERCGHSHPRTIEGWEPALRSAGFLVDHSTYFFTGAEVFAWGVLRMRLVCAPWCVFDRLRRVSAFVPPAARRLAVALTRQFLVRMPDQSTRPSERGGYLFVLATKTPGA
jgi:SAM-dependent methyltransferase